MTRTCKHTLITSLTLLAAFTAISALAQDNTAPTEFMYQGRLIDGTTLVNGQKTMAFRIYDGAESNEWGTGIWPAYAQTTVVDVVDGLFSVAIGGQANEMTMDPDYPLAFLANPDMAAVMGTSFWLEVEMDGVVLGPREKLQAVPFALTARGMPNDSLDGNELKSDAITSRHLADGQVSTDHIKDNTIRFHDIWFNHATNNQIMRWSGSAWIASDDWTSSGGGGSSPVDHGSLANLGVGDDHDQYLLGNGNDDHTSGTLTFSAASTLDVNGTFRAEDLYLGHNDSDDDDTLFFDGGLASLMWDNDPGRFAFSDGLHVDGGLGVAGLLNVDADAYLGGGGTDYGGDAELIGLRGRRDTWWIGVQNESTPAASGFFIGLGTVEDGIFHIENDGDVGIGTSTPTGKLQVIGGEVRIGTGTPRYLHGSGDLYVEDDIEVGESLMASHASIGRGRAETGLSPRIDIDAQSGSWNMGVQNSAEEEDTDFWIGKHDFRSDGTFHIENDGDVGIGTTEPTAKLDVRGDISASGTVRTGSIRARDGDDLTLSTDDGTIRVKIADSGSVGIGTPGSTTPQETLHVFGGRVLLDSRSVHDFPKLFFRSLDGADVEHTDHLEYDGSRFTTSCDLDINGTLTKDGGSFKIDHPLDPENKYLSHSFVESPDMMNVYNGNVVLDDAGEATVELPDWFEALNKDFRYQLTPIGAPGPNLYVAEEITNNQFRIAGGKSGLKVSWQVTGIRQDAYANAHRIPVEEDKPEAERGTYRHPELYGEPKTKAVGYQE